MEHKVVIDGVTYVPHDDLRDRADDVARKQQDRADLLTTVADDDDF